MSCRRIAAAAVMCELCVYVVCWCSQRYHRLLWLNRVRQISVQSKQNAERMADRRRRAVQAGVEVKDEAEEDEDEVDNDDEDDEAGVEVDEDCIEDSCKTSSSSSTSSSPRKRAKIAGRGAVATRRRHAETVTDADKELWRIADELVGAASWRILADRAHTTRASVSNWRWGGVSVHLRQVINQAVMDWQAEVKKKNECWEW